MMAKKSATNRRKKIRESTGPLAISSPAWLVEWLNAKSNSDSGVDINWMSALSYAPVYSCVNKISSHVSYLPMVCYERDRNDPAIKAEAKTHSATWLVRHRANEFQTSNVFRKTMQAHALLTGSGRAKIVRNLRGEPAELITLDPERTKTVWLGMDEETTDDSAVVARDGTIAWQKWHRVKFKNSNESTWIPDSECFHLMGLSWDGISGLSIVDLARNSFGLGVASERSQNRLYRSGGKPSFFLSSPPGVLRDEAEAQEFMQSFRRDHDGIENTGKVALLREGITATTLQFNSQENQTHEQRLFQRQESALWFAVEQILGDDSSVSYRSLEEKNRAYVANCLMAWLDTWCQEAWNKLLTERQKFAGTHFFKFTTEALLQGTTKERYEVYQIARQIEVLSANEVRELEDMGPRDGGDEYKNPAINPNPSGTKTGTSSSAESRLRDVISGRLKEMISVETNRLGKQIQHNAAGFPDWVKEFYSRGHFLDRIAKVMKDLGGTEKMAEEYANQSKAEVDFIVTTSAADVVSQRLSEQIRTWPDRADALAVELVRTGE